MIAYNNNKTWPDCRGGKETAKKIANKFKSFFGKRKRRAIDSSALRLSRAEANEVLGIDKRGRLCFSVQQVLNGVGKAFKPLVSQADALLKPLLKKIPSFNIPGKPSSSVHIYREFVLHSKS